MARLRIAVATADYRRGLKAAIPLAKAAGAQGVAFDLRSELNPGEFGDTAVRQLQHQIDQHGLQVGTAYFPLRLPLSEAVHADERIAAITSAMKLARRIRAGSLAIATGPLPPSQSRDDERLIETINAIAAAGNQNGTVPCLGFGRQPATRIKGLLDGIHQGPVMIEINPLDWLAEGLTESAARKLRLEELSFRGGDSENGDAIQTLEAFIRAWPQSIGHVQARDGRLAGGGTHVETAVGTGQVDWPLLVALLDEAAYSGWLTVRREMSDASDDIASGVAYLNHLQMH